MRKTRKIAVLVAGMTLAACSGTSSGTTSGAGTTGSGTSTQVRADGSATPAGTAGTAGTAGALTCPESVVLPANLPTLPASESRIPTEGLLAPGWGGEDAQTGAVDDTVICHYGAVKGYSSAQLAKAEASGALLPARTAALAGQKRYATDATSGPTLAEELADLPVVYANQPLSPCRADPTTLTTYLVGLRRGSQTLWIGVAADQNGCGTATNGHQMSDTNVAATVIPWFQGKPPGASSICAQPAWGKQGDDATVLPRTDSMGITVCSGSHGRAIGELKVAPVMDAVDALSYRRVTTPPVQKCPAGGPRYVLKFGYARHATSQLLVDSRCSPQVVGRKFVSDDAGALEAVIAAALAGK